MAINHKIEFGQAYCKDLLKRNTRKFILYFFEFYCIFYEFWNLKGITPRRHASPRQLASRACALEQSLCSGLPRQHDCQAPNDAGSSTRSSPIAPLLHGEPVGQGEAIGASPEWQRDM
jgi:hypothetical protein